MSDTVDAELLDELRTVVREVLGGPGSTPEWDLVAELGWLALEVPEALDGADAGGAASAVVWEEAGRAVASLPLFGTASGIAALTRVEPGDRRDELLRQAGAGDQRLAVAFTPNGDSWCAEPAFELTNGRLSGEALHVLDAPSATTLLVLADALGAAGADGPLVVAVPLADLAVESLPVLDETRAIGAVRADGVLVADDAVLRFDGDPGRMSQQVVDVGSVALAADALGVASSALDQTVAYVREREQFGRPVGSFQAVKHQCADVHVELRVGRELLDQAVAAVSDPMTAPEAVALAASRAKSFLTEAAVRAAGVAVQLHGGIGYTWESGLHRYQKRAMLDRALFGSPAEHRRRIGGLIADDIGVRS